MLAGGAKKLMACCLAALRAWGSARLTVLGVMACGSARVEVEEESRRREEVRRANMVCCIAFDVLLVCCVR